MVRLLRPRRHHHLAERHECLAAVLETIAGQNAAEAGAAVQPQPYRSKQ
jgi:hypothetical protein